MLEILLCFWRAIFRIPDLGELDSYAMSLAKTCSPQTRKWRVVGFSQIEDYFLYLVVIYFHRKMALRVCRMLREADLASAQVGVGDA